MRHFHDIIQRTIEYWLHDEGWSIDVQGACERKSCHATSHLCVYFLTVLKVSISVNNDSLKIDVRRKIDEIIVDSSVRKRDCHTNEYISTKLQQQVAPLRWFPSFLQ